MSTTLEVQTPKPIGATKASVDEFAKIIANKIGYDNSKSIEDIVTKLGGKIEYTGWDDDFDGKDASLIVTDKKNFIVKLSGLCGPDRNRFSIAHELGHYFIHYLYQGLEGQFEAARSGNSNDKAEWEANWFAGAFLMPADEFREASKKYNGDSQLLASEFSVSAAAVKVRKQVLGI